MAPHGGAGGKSAIAQWNFHAFSWADGCVTGLFLHAAGRRAYAAGQGVKALPVCWWRAPPPSLSSLTLRGDQMSKRRTRPRTLALAASGLLVGALLASGTAAAAPSHSAGAAATSASKVNTGPPAGAPVTSPAPGQVFTPGSNIRLSAAPLL